MHPRTPCKFQHVIARSGAAAPRRGNPHPPRETYQVDCCSGKFVALFVFAGKNYFLFCGSARRSGLPRRFAPRNDMLKLAACLRGQGRNDSPKPAPIYACKYVLPGQARSRLQIRLGARLCTRAHLSSFCMSLRGAGRPPRDVAIRIPPGKLAKLALLQANPWLFSVFALGAALCFVLPQEKRIATSLRSSQ